MASRWQCGLMFHSRLWQLRECCNDRVGDGAALVPLRPRQLPALRASWCFFMGSLSCSSSFPSCWQLLQGRYCLSLLSPGRGRVACANSVLFMRVWAGVVCTLSSVRLAGRLSTCSGLTPLYFCPARRSLANTGGFSAHFKHSRGRSTRLRASCCVLLVFPSRRILHTVNSLRGGGTRVLDVRGNACSDAGTNILYRGRGSGQLFRSSPPAAAYTVFAARGLRWHFSPAGGVRGWAPLWQNFSHGL